MILTMINRCPPAAALTLSDIAQRPTVRNPELPFSPLRPEQAASELLQWILNLSWNSFLPITMNTELQSQIPLKVNGTKYRGNLMHSNPQCRLKSDSEFSFQ